jgi:SAM-dependent methyltransferase
MAAVVIAGVGASERPYAPVVEHDWQIESDRAVRSFDVIADLYREKYADELDRKPYDRALLDELAVALRRDGSAAPVLEVGAGPGQISAYLQAHGVPVITSDASRAQTIEARRLVPRRPALVADLARLPVKRGGVGAIVAFYCLIFGPPGPLDTVFAAWRRALPDGGRVVVAVHAGEGAIHVEEWHGRAVDMTVVRRDPDDLVARLARQGFQIDRAETRSPYPHEQEERLYVVARAR